MIQMWNENLCKQSQSVLFIVRVIRHSERQSRMAMIKNLFSEYLASVLQAILNMSEINGSPCYHRH